MRRSICYTEPVHALAGETNTWKFFYSPATNLPKGTVLRFDLACKGRAIDWEAPTSVISEKGNCIWIDDGHGHKLSAKEIDRPDGVVPFYDFKLPCEVKAGAPLIFCIGCPTAQKKKTHGNKAQLTIQRRRPFNVLVDTSGKGHWSEPEIFSLDVKGNALKTIKILAPSLTVKNKRFDIILRFEDEFGNLTNNAPENTLIELTHSNLRESLNWKLFLPETGFLAIPNLYFNEIGVYSIQLKNLSSGELFYSSPIKCLPEDSQSIFWGLLHGESERFDSTESIDSCLRHFRDEKSLNFYATSSPDNQEETSPAAWKTICQHVQELNDDERFCVFLGQQWTSKEPSEGIRQFIYSKDEKPLIRQKEMRTSSLKKLYKSSAAKEFISIPICTMSDKGGYNFEEFDPEFERVVEIYNAWGSSESTKKEGNRYPIHSSSKKGFHENKEGSCLLALMKNKRFGFVSGGLDDRGAFSELFESDQDQYSAGLTAILADTLSRSDLFEALYQRRCYATTGDRIILNYTLAQKKMGAELNTADKPGLETIRHITGYVAGTSPIETIEIVRNGEVMCHFEPKATHFDFEWDDLESLESICLKDTKNNTLFSFYYVRVRFKNGHMAWGSPIWVDTVKNQKKAKPAPIAKPEKKVVKK